jgi:hypothetical protein
MSNNEHRLSYGNDLLDSVQRVASYVDRILKGATPNELPVQAPVKFELVFNSMATDDDWCVRLGIRQRNGPRSFQSTGTGAALSFLLHNAPVPLAGALVSVPVFG